MEIAFAGAEGPADAGAERIDDTLVHNEERRLVARAVAELPDIYREVIVLAHYDGRSVEEIAEVLDLGLSAVKMRLQRARGMILKAMEQAYA